MSAGAWSSWATSPTPSAASSRPSSPRWGRSAARPISGCSKRWRRWSRSCRGRSSVESERQSREGAEAVKQAGASILRGGAYKPRSSPYAFQGLKEQGLRYLKEAKTRTGLPVVTEVLETESVELVAEYADMLQIGARNIQNFTLLRRVGEMGKPVLLKRGMATSIQEFLLSAEYILSAGNPNVILCERGIRTFETATRFTLDLNAVPVVKRLSHLPVVVDPSHGTGHWGDADGGRRGRRRRPHDRGAPAPRGGALGRAPVAQARALQHADGARAPGRSRPRPGRLTPRAAAPGAGARPRRARRGAPGAPPTAPAPPAERPDVAAAPRPAPKPPRAAPP